MNCKQKQTKKRQLLNKYGACCWWCRKSALIDQLTLEHILPKSHGGSNSLENLRLACFTCNHSRGNSLFPPNFSK